MNTRRFKQGSHKKRNGEEEHRGSTHLRKRASATRREKRAHIEGIEPCPHEPRSQDSLDPRFAIQLFKHQIPSPYQDGQPSTIHPGNDPLASSMAQTNSEKTRLSGGLSAKPVHMANNGRILRALSSIKPNIRPIQRHARPPDTVSFIPATFFHFPRAT